MTDPNSATLDKLMLSAGRGDETAFRRFYDAVSPSLLAFLLRLLRDRFQAEDVLQESMLTAWNKADQFDSSKATAKIWITTIAHRRALDVLRSSTRHREIGDQRAEDIRTTLGLTRDKAVASSESSATAERLAHCFGELSDESAACIRFAYLDGLTMREVAQAIDRSLNSVKSWIRRGMASLSKCMQS